MTFFANLFPRVVNLSAVAGIVILFVLMARLFLRKAPKVFSYALWAIVLVRLLIPLSIPSPVSAVPEIQTTNDAEINMVLPEIEFETPADRQQNIQNLEASIEQNIAYVPTKTTIEPASYLAFGWLAGMAIMTLYSVLSFLSIRRKVEISLPLRDNIYLADDIRSPFVIGLIRPKIYLPCNLEEREQEYIILHEQHHIRRFDHIAKALAFLALAIHWFNPLVWLAFVLSARDMEMSCDEAVIRRLGEGIRAEYSASLLTLATGKRIIAGTPLAFGEGDTKGRIRNLANWKRPGLWIIVIAVILCIVLAVCLLTNPMEDNGDNDGVTWYYGTVVDSAMSAVNEGDREGRSYITLRCDDGEERLFWLGKYCQEPGDILGKYVMVQGMTENGTGLPIVTSIRITDPSVLESLDDAIHQAIIDFNSGKNLEGQCKTAHFKVLSREKTGIISEAGVEAVESVTVYGIALYQEYDLKDGILEDVSGACCPTVLTFSVDSDGKLTLTEYWVPRDGTYYPIDIREKFEGCSYPDIQKYRAEQQLNTYAQAMEYFGVGTDVVINTLINEICDHSRWTDGFLDLMEQCSREVSMLNAYGSDTLRYCFTEFMNGGQDDLKGQVMAYVCENIMESVGEETIADWSYSRSGQDWFQYFTSRALSLIHREEMTQDEIKLKYPVSWIYLEMTGAFDESPAWGLTMQAENVTSTGLTLVVTQSGVFTTGSLTTGQPYILEKNGKGQWKSLPTVLDEWVWTMEAWGIPMNDTVRWNVNWSWLYGELPPGHYRIGKDISSDEYGNAMFYAEFVIE